MAESKINLKLDALDARVREPVSAFAEEFISALGDNLLSITVVGSSLTGDFRPGHSDINTVLVLREQTVAALNATASLARPMSKKKLSPPLLMTSSYIERSRDVFGVELLDFQLTHQTILGDDPFAPLKFEKKDVRLQCERELKAMLIRLRQGYIASAANRKLVRDILISTAKGLAPFLRAMLWLRDIERPRLTEPTFNKAAAEFSISLDALTTAGRWRHEKIRLGEAEMENAFLSVYSTVEQLADAVDRFEV
ncbi:MAG TPA: hypothetical protein VMW24_11280 [Sedimentisphaerales bacterium]|nr:hypothetical protein [Sedimentisphaerales bacterium]